jgi:RNA recognition motif. (a.k.a. RRM, RBD, or RNP domain)
MHLLCSLVLHLRTRKDAELPAILCTGFCRVISNLDYKVSDEDVKELFEAFGPIKRSGVIYDRR